MKNSKEMARIAYEALEEYVLCECICGDNVAKLLKPLIILDVVVILLLLSIAFVALFSISR